jgi:hypothetical protein
MAKPFQIEIERLRYWQGQQLRSRDFRDQMMIEAQLRWWHNRALHHAYGVRYGLAVSRVDAAGALVAVRVDCGVAYDCFGRELILQAAREIPLPTPGSKPAILTLLIRYKDTAEFPAKRDVSGACAPCGRALSLERPEFLWKPAHLVEVVDGVALAQVSDDGQGFDLRENFSAPLSRPLARPRIASGATVPEGTAWEKWSERVSDANRNLSEVAVGYQVTVDTSAAGFTETPCYFAWLEGTLWETGRSNLEFFPTPFAHIDQASLKQFRFRLWLPMIDTLLGARLRISNFQFETEFINFARRQRLYVCWLGIQPSLSEMTGPRCIAVAEPECFTVNED